jgi:hypothetical protein
MRGQCCCGAVQFETGAAVRDVFVCHCSKCRRWHGHAGAYARFVRSELVFTEQRGLAWYPVRNARRGFCRECGSSLFFDHAADRKAISVCAGALDGPTGLGIAAHIFVASKGDYYAVPTDAPVHDGPPPQRKMPATTAVLGNTQVSLSPCPAAPAGAAPK